MNTQIQTSIDRIAGQARARYFALIDGARKGTKNAAGLVRKTKGPIEVASKLGLKLTRVSHKTADGVLKQQTKLVENQIDAFAARLQAAARAKDLRSLVKTQFDMLPESAARFADDTRKTVGIIAGAGKEVGGLLKDTVVDLRGKTPVKTTAKKAAKKTAKKVSRKKAAVKKTAGKTAAKVEKSATKVVDKAIEVAADVQAAA